MIFLILSNSIAIAGALAAPWPVPTNSHQLAVTEPIIDTANPENGNRSETKTKKARKTVQLETLHIPRASELVAGRLRSLIVMGEVAPGASLPSEKELVKQLGVSRATLREALRIIEAEGLIATRPGSKGGIVVQRPGTANLTRSLSLLLQLEATPFEMLLEARRLLEPLCANLAAERSTNAEIEQLRIYTEAMRQSLGDVQEYVQAQLKFHLKLMACAHNDVLRLYTTSVGELISSLTASVGLTETEQLTGVKAAEGILDAIIGKNGSLASRRTEAHLRGFEAVLLEKMAKR